MVPESLLSEEGSEIATKNAKTAKREGPNVSLDVRWLDTHREEKRIIATKNAKIAKKGRAKCFFRCVVVRGLTTPQKRTVENSHKERRDRTGGWAKCFFRCPVVRESLLSEEGQ